MRRCVRVFLLDSLRLSQESQDYKSWPVVRYAALL